VATSADANSLSGFAAGHGLEYSRTVALPAQGSTLSRDGAKVEGAATGALPGGIDGTLCHYTYTYT
jgi:hypothetical protein